MDLSIFHPTVSFRCHKPKKTVVWILFSELIMIANIFCLLNVYVFFTQLYISLISLQAMKEKVEEHKMEWKGVERWNRLHARLKEYLK